MGEREFQTVEDEIETDEGLETFAGYEVHEELGRGGMAMVHRAELVGPGGATKEVALKRILPQPEALDPDDDAAKRARLFEERFLLEMANAAKLSHPNIVHVLSFGTFAGTHYIVLELIRGMDLRRLMRKLQRLATGREKIHYRHDKAAQAVFWKYEEIFAKRQLPEHLAAYVALEVCQGLAYAHQFTVHRDVSEDNKMISVEGEVKINDWGIAKAKRDGASVVTKTGKAYGKPAYMSPEQFRGQELDGRSDLYSLGIMLFRLLSGGRHPYDSPSGGHDDDMARAFRAAIRERGPIADLLPHVSPAMHALLDRTGEGTTGLIEPSPDHRPDSAEALIRPLKAIVGDVFDAKAELRQLVRLAYFGEPKTIRDPKAVRRAMSASRPSPSQPGSGDVPVSQVVTKHERAARTDASEPEITAPGAAPTKPISATAPLPSDVVPETRERSRTLSMAVIALSAVVVLLLAGTASFYAGAFGTNDATRTPATDRGPEGQAEASHPRPSSPLATDPEPPAPEPPERAESAIVDPAPVAPVEPSPELAAVTAEPEPTGTMESAEAAPRGTLVLTAAPLGELFVNGRYAGTDTARVRVRPGSHRIGVGPRGSRAPTRTETVQVFAGATVQRIPHP